MDFERFGVAHTVSRRSALRALFGGASVALLAACGPQAPTLAPTAAPTSQASGAGAAARPPASGTVTTANPTPASGAAPTPNATQATAAGVAAPTAAAQPRSGGTLRAGLVGD